jgi:hypothetical protein
MHDVSMKKYIYVECGQYSPPRIGYRTQVNNCPLPENNDSDIPSDVRALTSLEDFEEPERCPLLAVRTITCVERKLRGEESFT